MLVTVLTLNEMGEKTVNKGRRVKSGSQGGADGVVGGAEQFYQEYGVVYLR